MNTKQQNLMQPQQPGRGNCQKTGLVLFSLTPQLPKPAKCYLMKYVHLPNPHNSICSIQYISHVICFTQLIQRLN